MGGALGWILIGTQAGRLCHCKAHAHAMVTLLSR